MSLQKIVYLSLLLVTCGTSRALADEPVSRSFFGGIAIGGYDTVAYRKQPDGMHKATKGTSKLSVNWKGAKWRFASQENRSTFAASPTKYAPAYNGFCANALSLGNGLVKTDGTHWQIYDNQLYLFYSKEGRERWLHGDYHEYKKAADKAWQSILSAENR